MVTGDKEAQHITTTSDIPLAPLAIPLLSLWMLLVPHCDPQGPLSYPWQQGWVGTAHTWCPFVHTGELSPGKSSLCTASCYGAAGDLRKAPIYLKKSRLSWLLSEMETLRTFLCTEGVHSGAINLLTSRAARQWWAAIRGPETAWWLLAVIAQRAPGPGQQLLLLAAGTKSS